MIRRLLQTALCFILCPLLVAQQNPAASVTFDTPENSKSASAPHALPEYVTLPKYTVLRIVLLETVSSATATKGQMVRMTVGEDEKVNGLVVIPEGAHVTGKVTHLRRSIPGKRNGSIHAEPTNLTLGNGTLVRLRHNRPGEDDCGEMGPCWIWWTFLAPLSLVGIAHDTIRHRHSKPEGRDETQTACSGFGLLVYTANPTILRFTDLQSAKPAPEDLSCINHSFPDANHIRQ